MRFSFSFKVISQTCVFKSIASLPLPIRDVNHLKNDWLKSGVTLIRTLLTEKWISAMIDCVNISGRKENTLNMNMYPVGLFRLILHGYTWKLGVWQCYLKFDISAKTRYISVKLTCSVQNECRFMCVKFYLNWYRFPGNIWGAHFFCGHRRVYYELARTCVGCMWCEQVMIDL